MLKYADILRSVKDLITGRAFYRPVGEGAQAEADLDLIMETVSVLDYDMDYLPGSELNSICNDSRKITANSIFAAITGAASDGKKFVPQALEKGAKIVISDSSVENMLIPGTVNLIVSDCYKAYARLCELMYDHPAKEFNSFAITGTNGKTTSAMLIRMLLAHAGQPCGMISTVEYDLGNGEISAAERTTPEAAELFAAFDRMRSNQLKNMVMEVSSHALAQSRIGSMQFKAAIFTNLTGDHLDYHHTFEEYFRVKKLLFTQHMAPESIAIINSDDPYGKILEEDSGVKNAVSFGINHGKWRIKNVASSAAGVNFTLDNGSSCANFSSNLVGLHNIYNIAGVVLALHESKVMLLERSAEILKNTVFAVPGRLEAIKLANGATAFVDYAHTADALKNVLSSLKQLPHNRLICVFGAGGNRDKTKRPQMGRAAAELADKIYLTSDNPRDENPESIISEIAAGIPAEYDFIAEPDRCKAINMALQQTQNGDIVLIAGKGHEDYQEIKGIKYHLDDRETVRKFTFN